MSTTEDFVKEVNEMVRQAEAADEQDKKLDAFYFQLAEDTAERIDDAIENDEVTDEMVKAFYHIYLSIANHFEHSNIGYNDNLVKFYTASARLEESYGNKFLKNNNFTKISKIAFEHLSSAGHRYRLAASHSNDYHSDILGTCLKAGSNLLSAAAFDFAAVESFDLAEECLSTARTNLQKIIEIQERQLSLRYSSALNSIFDADIVLDAGLGSNVEINRGLLDEINGQSKEIASQRRQQNLALEAQEANIKEADEVEEVGF